jgi:hypothetical protein
MIRLLARNSEHESAVLSQMRELAQEINSRRLKAKRAAKIIRGIFQSGGLGGARLSVHT